MPCDSYVKSAESYKRPLTVQSPRAKIRLGCLRHTERSVVGKPAGRPFLWHFRAVFEKRCLGISRWSLQVRAGTDKAFLQRASVGTTIDAVDPIDHGFIGPQRLVAILELASTVCVVGVLRRFRIIHLLFAADLFIVRPMVGNSSAAVYYFDIVSGESPQRETSR